MPTNHAKKRRALGIHYLKDKKVIDAIVLEAMTAFEKFEPSQILEVGPGRGSLTLPMLEALRQRGTPKDFRYLAIDTDYVIENYWEHCWGKPWNLHEKPAFFEFICADFLKLDSQKWVRPNTLVVSNLPYSVGTPILLKMHEFYESFCKLILMFQLEVADRIVSAPGSPKSHRLGIFLQNSWAARSLLTVPKTAFSPPPKVQSKVIEMVPLTKPLLALNQSECTQFEELLSLSFSQRRRMLRGLFRSNRRWDDALKSLPELETRRAESLNWEEWKLLFQAGLQNSKEKSS